MGAPVYNTHIGNGAMRQPKNPMVTPRSGGLHDILAKGQKLYGLGSVAYGAYQTYQRVLPLVEEGLPLLRAGIEGMAEAAIAL